MNLEKKRKQECFQAECKYAENRCLVFHGANCIRLDGNRIPVQRSMGEVRMPTQKLSAMKPYFLAGLPELEGDL